MKASKLTKETILNIDTKDRGFPIFKVGDAIEVSQLVKDGDKERLQAFEGDVIDIHKNGISTTFTVRRIGANGIGVERIFPYYSKNVSEIKFIRHGRVRRAKLTYLRERVGKMARVKEQTKVAKKSVQATNA